MNSTRMTNLTTNNKFSNSENQKMHEKCLTCLIQMIHSSCIDMHDRHLIRLTADITIGREITLKLI